jgi:hypothetical protein
MMKRGCTAFISAKDPSIAEPLRNWCPNLKIVANSEDLFTLAREHDCIGVALSLSIGEIEKSKPLKGDLPVFYPLIGMNEEEIRGLLDRIEA